MHGEPKVDGVLGVKRSGDDALCRAVVGRRIWLVEFRSDAGIVTKMVRTKRPRTSLLQEISASLSK